jgi:hypothetical protein
MLSKLRPRSLYDVLAAIAFFAVVAGGSAYAAATIGSKDIKKNAVLSKHIKNGQVKSSDLGANSVASNKIKDGQVNGDDLAANSVGSDKIIDGSISGLDLAANSVGSDKIIDGQVRGSELGPLIVRTGAKYTLPPGSANDAFADCNTGEQPISGGGETLHTSGIGLVMADSLPHTQTTPDGLVPVGWAVGYSNTTTNTLSFTPYVLCLAR